MHITTRKLGASILVSHPLHIWRPVPRLPGSTSLYPQILGTGFWTLSYQFLRATRSIERISYGNVAGWVDHGWVAVCHSRYCIKTTKPILKLFRPFGSPIIKHLGPLTPIPNSKGNPFSGGVKYTGVGKLVIFVRYSTENAVYL